MPHNGLQVIPHPMLAKEQTVYIVPMISFDYLTLPTDDYWRELASPAYSTEQVIGLAEFFVPTRAIYLPGEWDYVPQQRALRLLHEGHHAYDHMAVGEAHMPQPFWRRETNAHQLEVRILGNIGGKAFADYLDSLAPDAGRHLAASAQPGIFEVPACLANDALLDRVLWPTLTRAQQKDRWTDVQRCAVAHYLAKTYGAENLHQRYGHYVQNNYVMPAQPQHLE